MLDSPCLQLLRETFKGASFHFVFFFCLFSQGWGTWGPGCTKDAVQSGQFKKAQGPRGVGPSLAVAVLPHPALQGHGDKDPGNCPRAGAGEPLFSQSVPRSQYPPLEIFGGGGHPHSALQNPTFHGSREDRSTGGLAASWPRLVSKLDASLTGILFRLQFNLFSASFPGGQRLMSSEARFSKDPVT